jgi:leader peptidase (prepilin peptidase)/N-methyltransferase
MWTAVEYACIGALSGPVLARWTSNAIEGPVVTEPERLSRVIVFCAMTAAVLFSLAARWSMSSAVLGFGWFGMTGIVLCALDLDHHRLPHGVVASMFGGGLALLGIAAVVDGEPSVLVRALAIAALIFIGSFAVALLAPGHLGFGDVTLFGTVSLYLGWAGWQALYVALTTTAALGALAGVVMIAVGRRRDRFAFGPMILGGAVVGLLVP